MNVMGKLKSKICPVTRCLILHCIEYYIKSRDLNTLKYNAKKHGSLEKIQQPPPPWFENAPSLGAKSLKYPDCGGGNETNSRTTCYV